MLNHNQLYYEEFINWGDFLGTNTIASKDMGEIFLDFEHAREFVHKLYLKHTDDWQDYVTSGNKPYNIPSCPQKVYKDKFINFEDWMGYKGHARNLIKKFNKKHNFKYDYKLVFLGNLQENVDIICKEHSVFNLKAYKHLRGDGCPSCKLNNH